jgi:hypothetical protein
MDALGCKNVARVVSTSGIKFSFSVSDGVASYDSLARFGQKEANLVQKKPWRAINHVFGIGGGLGDFMRKATRRAR